ncbi:Metridin-like ShK toxin [Aphelenchoides avenae]|nr:Metridin-like ShK toxin [Aphelenchus avenae]
MPPLRCQNPDGTPTALATACQDKLGESDCKAIFAGPTQAPAAGGPAGGPPAAGGAAAPAMRPALCDNQATYALSRQCAKTCMICCETVEHGCQDDPAYGINCPQMKYLCKDPSFESVLNKACAATCGLCATTTCRDQINACANLKTLCRDFAQRTFMQANCARTCGFCSDLFGFNGGNVGIPGVGQGGFGAGGVGGIGGCADKNAPGRGSDCPGLRAYCNNPAYSAVMRDQCPATCGFCG